MKTTRILWTAFLLLGVACCSTRLAAQDERADQRKVHLPKFLTPNGKPASGTWLVSCKSAPVHVQIGSSGIVFRDMDGRPEDHIQNSDRSWRAVMDSNGSLPLTEQGQAGHHLFGVHDTGYLNVPIVQVHTQESVRLIPWQTCRGEIHINSKPLKTGVVVANWEPYPAAPGGWTGPPNRSKALAHITLKTVAEVKNGKFQFTQLPKGRVQFMVHPRRTIQSNAIWDESTQLTWWETVTENATELHPPENFDVITVKGKLDLTNTYLSERSTGPPSVSQLNENLFSVNFQRVPSENDNLGGLDEFSFHYSTYDEYLTAAKQWAAPGGLREQNERNVRNLGLQVILNPDLTFSVDVKPNDYTIRFLVKHDRNPEFLVWLMPFKNFRLNAVSSRATDSVIDLGVLKLTNVDREFVAPDIQVGEPIATTVPQATVPQVTAQQDPVDTPRALESEFERMLHEKYGARVQSPEKTGRPGDTIVELPMGLHRSRELSGSSVAQDNLTEPIDNALGELLTGLLSEDDPDAKQNLTKPLRLLLLQKFDQEQKRREQTVVQLRERLEAAEVRVKERATNRDQIIQQQLNRLLELQDL